MSSSWTIALPTSLSAGALLRGNRDAPDQLARFLHARRSRRSLACALGLLVAVAIFDRLPMEARIYARIGRARASARTRKPQPRNRARNRRPLASTAALSARMLVRRRALDGPDDIGHALELRRSWPFPRPRRTAPAPARRLRVFASTEACSQFCALWRTVRESSSMPRRFAEESTPAVRCAAEVGAGARDLAQPREGIGRLRTPETMPPTLLRRA
jgi:hypothetical protein